MLEAGAGGPPAKALHLVDVDDYWMVLSEMGARTYVSGTRLVEGARVFFRPRGRGEAETWRVELHESIPNDEVARRFGDEAAERARSDARSLVVDVSIVDRE